LRNAWSTLVLVSLTLQVGGCTMPPCDLTLYPDVSVDGTVVYVDATIGWLDGPGTCAEPFAEVSDAVEALDGSGGTLLVGAGLYDGDVQVDVPVSVFGLGPEQSEISGGEACVAAMQTESLHLQDIALDSCWYGLWSIGSQVSLTRVEVDHSLWFAAYIEGGEATFEECSIRDNGPGGPGEISGGILADHGTLTVIDSEIRDNAGLGIWSVGADLTVEGTVVSDATPDAMAGVGRGIELDGDPEGEPVALRVTNSVVERFSDAAVVVRDAALQVQGLTVSVATDCDSTLGGAGLALSGSDAVLGDLSVVQACGAALTAAGGGSLDVTDATLTDTVAGVDGVGAAVRLDQTPALITDSYLGASTGAALLASCTGSLHLTDTDVVGTGAGEANLGGDAVVVTDSQLSVHGGSFLDTYRCGLRITGDSTLAVAEATFDAGLGDVCTCDQILTEAWEGAFVEDNTPTEDGVPVIEADAGGTCPEPLPAGCS